MAATATNFDKIKKFQCPSDKELPGDYFGQWNLIKRSFLAWALDDQSKNARFVFVGCSCLDVWPGAMAVSSPWQILSLPQLTGSLVRPLIGQFSTRGPLIGWCRPHLMSLLLAIGHTGTTITTCHQLSAYWNVENMRSIWVYTGEGENLRWNKSISIFSFSIIHKIRRLGKKCNETLGWRFLFKQRD